MLVLEWKKQTGCVRHAIVPERNDIAVTTTGVAAKHCQTWYKQTGSHAALCIEMLPPRAGSLPRSAPRSAPARPSY